MNLPEKLVSLHNSISFLCKLEFTLYNLLNQFQPYTLNTNSYITFQFFY